MDRSRSMDGSVLGVMAAMVLAVAMQGLADTAGVYLPQIDVVSQKEDEKEKVAGSYTLIDKQTLAQLQPLSTQDALRCVPGVHAVETDGYGFYPRIGVRGLNPDMSKKVLLLEDGAPLQLGPFIDPAAYYNPPIERMERIELLKGSGSLRYGPSTIGGAVNYITRRPEPRRHGTASVMGGNLGYRSALFSYGDYWNGIAGVISYLRKTGDGWRGMGFSVDDVVLKVGAPMGDRQYVGIKATYYDQVANHSYLGLTEAEYRTNHRMNRAERDTMFVRRYSADINHEVELSERAVWNTLLYWNTATRDWWREGFSFADTTGLVDGYGQPVQSGANFMRNIVGGRLRDFTVVGLDSRLKLDYSFLGFVNAAEVGIRPHYEIMLNRRIDNAESALARTGDLREDDTRRVGALALFAINRLDLTERITLTPGLRIEHYGQYREIRRWNNAAVDTSNTHSHTVLIPGVGLSARALSQMTLFAGVHRGFAPPRVADAIGTSGQAVDLAAERSVNYELGLRGAVGPLGYELAGFRYDFDNQIIQAGEAGGQSAAGLTNAGKTLNQGLEAGLQLQPVECTVLDINATWVPVARFENDLFSSSGRQVRSAGNRLPYAPEILFNTRLGLIAGPFQGGVSLSHTGEQFSDADNTVAGSPDGMNGRLPAYTLLNADVSLQLNSLLRLQGSVKNIADSKYIASRAPQGMFPGAGRMLQAGATLEF